MIKKDYEWLDANRQLLGNVTMTRDKLQILFDMYNRITGDNKPSSCGRCVLNVKKRLKLAYEEQRSKNQRNNL